MTDIFLLQPPIPEQVRPFRKETILCPPLGLSYVASTLLSHEFDVKMMDFAIMDADICDVEAETRRQSPKIVAISTTTNTYKNALKSAKVSKEVDSDVITVLGGPHVTFTPNETLTHPEIDIVVRHEGEYTMVELCDVLLRGAGDIRRINGVSYRRNNQIVNNPPRPSIEDLDRLPFPARHLLPMSLYKIPGSLITSRGCPSDCIFCSAQAMSGRRYRVRSPQNVVSEIEEMSQLFKPDFFFVADDTFTIFRDRTRTICELFSQLGIKWVCESRANIMDKNIILELARSGCFAIQYGVESGSQKVLDSIEKNITVEQVRNAVRWSKEAKILPVCSFMVPHPEDTLETIAETKNLMLELKSMGALVFVSLTTPFPGTKLYERAEDLEVRMVSTDTDDFDLATAVIETKNLTIEQIESAYEDLSSICSEFLQFD